MTRYAPILLALSCAPPPVADCTIRSGPTWEETTLHWGNCPDPAAMSCTDRVYTQRDRCNADWEALCVWGAEQFNLTGTLAPSDVADWEGVMTVRGDKCESEWGVRYWGR